MSDTLFTLTGPSGVGKSTIEKMLVEKRNFKKVISHTSRPPRENEKYGEDYFFCTKEEILALRDSNKLAECTDYNGNYYAASIDELAKSDIMVVEPIGLREIIKNSPKRIQTIFLDVDEEEARRRMIERGDKEESINKRIESDRVRFYSLENQLNYDYIISTTHMNINSVYDLVSDIMDGKYEAYKNYYRGFVRLE